MFKFSTNTLINSATMPDGSPRFYVTNDGSVLRVKYHLQFRDQNVVGVYKRAYEAPQRAQVSIDMGLITKPGVYRIALYLRLSGSQNSYFANDFVFKGKPFFIEFYAKADKEDPTKLADDAATIAKRVERIAKKYLNMVYEFPLVDVKADGDKVILTASDEYQRFKMVRLEWYNEEAKSYDCCANFGRFEGEDDINEMSPIYQGKIEYTVDEETGKERVGHEGFGTFRQITKDLRLPTAANTRWNRIAIDETPMPHGKYTQYIIKYCVNRGIMGSDAVGEVTKSLTNHVFYVESAVIDAWEEALKSIIGEGEDIKTNVETVNKDKDDQRLISSDGETYSQDDIDKAHGKGADPKPEDAPTNWNENDDFLAPKKDGGNDEGGDNAGGGGNNP